MTYIDTHRESFGVEPICEFLEIAPSTNYARKSRPPCARAIRDGELIYNEHFGPWRTVEDVALATLSWVHWWNHERLLEPIGYVPPAEFEASLREAIENGALSSPGSPDLETGDTDHPGNETLGGHTLAGVSS